ncbi:fasciclin domain-containing protein [Planctomycetaceae bacterium]|nr:fasciclin domain-containing protein [Planctomycetaceae bacterium]
MKKFKNTCLQPVLLALSLMAVCGSANAADNIVEVADKAGTFKTLLAAAKAAGLAHTLQEDGPFTVFAPTDDAFAKLPKHTLSDLLKPENKEKLATILKYHVIPGKVTAKDAVQVGSAKTLSGDSVSISIRDGRLAVNDANVIVNDVEASNGIIHVIDRVLIPPTTVGRIISQRKDLSSFSELLEKTQIGANLTEGLDRVNYTVFVPNNKAFESLPEGAFTTPLDPCNDDRLRTAFYDHIAWSAIPPLKLEEFTTLRMVTGQRLPIDYKNNAFGGAAFTGEVIPCFNGVIYVIDKFLANGVVNIVEVADSASVSNIVEVADKAGTFKTLLAAAKAAGLAHTLQEDGPFTVFAPTDDAFAKLPKPTLNDLLKPENKEKLATILKYHVISAKVTAKDAVQVESAETLSGDSLRISIRDGRLAVNDASVIVNDLKASNGIIHVIDAVLIPPEPKNIVETAAAAGKFKTLLAAVEAAGLAEELKGEGPFTVLAPSDEAFAKLPHGTIESLLKPENKQELQAILKYHLIPGRIFQSEIFRIDNARNGLAYRTLTRAFVFTSIRDGRLCFNDANVVANDVEASNGIIHVIDSVLMPPKPKNIVETAADAGNFKTLIAAVKAAGLVETLQGEGPFTVLAPSDEAFAKLTHGTIESLLKPENKQQLQSLLRYHVLSGRRTVQDLAPVSSRQANSAKAIDGKLIKVSLDPFASSPLTFNSSQVVKSDISASNGIIHVIDRVLTPPADSVVKDVFKSDFRLLQRLDPQLESKIKSDNGPTTTVTFCNLSGKPIQVYWIGGSGKRKKWRGLIAPGALEICQRSFSGNVWLIADEHEKGLGLYVLDSQDGLIVHK